LNRIGIGPCLPLVLSFFQRFAETPKRIVFLKALERHSFIISLVSPSSMRYYGIHSNNPSLVLWAVELSTGKLSSEKIVKKISDSCDEIIKSSILRDAFQRLSINGFYDWGTIRYFLFEYNISLQERSKTSRPKIFWSEFIEERSDYITVEHIFPKQARDSYWISRFNKYSVKKRAILRNSLGNLLPLSRGKNASLSNSPFPDKVVGKKDEVVGYRYGSYCENEVALSEEWSADEILLRGLTMLDFMEKRWSVHLGPRDEKIKMLGLAFLSSQST